MSQKRNSPQNPLGLSRRDQKRLIAFHEAGHAVVAATFGQRVVRVQIDGAVPFVELTPLENKEYGFLAELATLCGGFTGVKAAFPDRDETVHRDGAQQDIGRVEDMARALVRGVCADSVSESQKLSRFLERFARRHQELNPGRFIVPEGDISEASIKSTELDGTIVRLFRLTVFLAQAEAKVRLSSRGGRAALHGAAHYLLEPGPKTAAAFNKVIEKGLRKDQAP